MEYEDIITAYKEGSLDISDLKNKLEMSKPLKGRPKYRAIEKVESKYVISSEITNLLSMSENPDKVEFFEKKLEKILEEYYASIISSIREVKAWQYMKLVPSEYSIEKFKELPNQKKFVKIYEITQKYFKFLDIQKIADIRDSFKPSGELSEEEIQQLALISKMYNSFDNKNVREEFFCFKNRFLTSLLNFKKSNKLRIEDYMQEKAKSVKPREKDIFRDYEWYSKFFTTEDYRDIIENLTLTSKTLKEPARKIIEYYSEMSESESEQIDLEEFVEEFKSLEKKYLVMNSIKIETEKTRRKDAQIELRKKQLEESRKRAEEFEERQRKAEEKLLRAHEKAERERIIGIKEGSTGEMEHDVSKQEETVAAREIVKPLVFFWFGKEDISLAKQIGVRKLNEFFKYLKEYENKTGTRISLFMITNADKSITKKRVKELQEKSEEKGMPRLVEGALGGYSSFKIDKNGNVIDIAKMSFENREKIKKLLDRKLQVGLPPDIIDETEENYLRYEFTDQKDASIDMRYLQIMATRLIRDKHISVQPLKFIPYIEKNKAGIDVLLTSQYKGLSQLADYYKAKYHLASGKGLQANVNSIDDFLSKTLSEKEDRE